MSGSVKAAAAVLAALGILCGIIGGFFKDKPLTFSADSIPIIVAEEVDPPINGRS